MIPKLLFDIAECKNFLALTALSNPKHPCDKIVEFQRTQKTKFKIKFQIPEPWNGDIVNAPILIVSSNPSYSHEELYPDLSWPKSIIADFFINRFTNRGPNLSWVYNNRILNRNGTRGKSVRYWSSITKRVNELIGRNSIPGIDYCITELVHCKSIKEIGVRNALPECSKQFFNGKNGISGSSLIVAIGRHARDYFHNNPTFTEKPIIYLPAPNAFGPKKLRDHYNENEIATYRQIFNNHENNRANIIYSDINLPNEIQLQNFFDTIINNK